tara:strand:+ start:6589 stop:6786 length:198 start_codon:yes stop_codon:yes gene_type:complete
LKGIPLELLLAMEETNKIFEILAAPQTWIVLTAISEIVGITPKLKSNSILQLLLSALWAIKPKKS